MKKIIKKILIKSENYSELIGIVVMQKFLKLSSCHFLCVC